MTGIAAHAQETVLETPALEVVLELLLHIPRQDRALRRQVFLERRVILVNNLIEEGPLLAMAHIRRRAATRTGFPASQQTFKPAVFSPSSLFSSEGGSENDAAGG